MSRGGRGGLAGGAGRMGGKDLPFTVDADLEDQVLAYHNEMNDEEEWTKTLYPVCCYHIPMLLQYWTDTDATPAHEHLPRPATHCSREATRERPPGIPQRRAQWTVLYRLSGCGQARPRRVQRL